MDIETDRMIDKLNQAITLMDELRTVDIYAMINDLENYADERYKKLKRKYRKSKAQVWELAESVARYERLLKRSKKDSSASSVKHVIPNLWDGSLR